VKNNVKLPLILASSSPRRKDLLARLHITPDQIIAADINEAPRKQELPKHLATRLSEEKAQKISAQIKVGYIIAADTIVTLGRRPLGKAENKDDVAKFLSLLSGRRHRVYTAVTIIKKSNNGDEIVRTKFSETIIKFKNLTGHEIASYAANGEGIGKAGGYSIQGYAESFVSFLSGSHSNVIGLPLFEVRNMLTSLGFFDSNH